MPPPLSKLPPVVIVRLYRNLLRAAKPFTAPMPNAKILNCLLSRTGIDDHISDWQAFVSAPSFPGNHEKARDLSVRFETSSYHASSSNDAATETKEVIPPNKTYQRLFRRLLREVVCNGDKEGIAKSTWPSLVDTTLLWNVIRREFRDGPDSQSIHFNSSTRRQVAFTTLRELNKKLAFFDYMENSSPKPLSNQAALTVSRLPFQPSTSHLRPGAFLLAHPHMKDSFFAKTVICILEHNDDERHRSTEEDDDDESTTERALCSVDYQTYGLIVNRASIDAGTGKNRTLKEAFEQHMLPAKLAEVFGDSIVREGGPFHVALQMLHCLPSSTVDIDSLGEDKGIGGRIIPMIPEGDDSSAALYSDRATYFQGEIFKAMTAVKDGLVDRDDVSFFVGASTWSKGQLQNEIAQGFWIPCRGSPEIAFSGICEHVSDTAKSRKRPLADLWLSMMSACGEEEARLAHLYYHEDDTHVNGLPLDAFDEDEIEIL